MSKDLDAVDVIDILTAVALGFGTLIIARDMPDISLKIVGVIAVAKMLGYLGFVTAIEK